MKSKNIKIMKISKICGKHQMFQHTFNWSLRRAEKNWIRDIFKKTEAKNFPKVSSVTQFRNPRNLVCPKQDKYEENQTRHITKDCELNIKRKSQQMLALVGKDTFQIKK